jgi:hypothetical protein
MQGEIPFVVDVSNADIMVNMIKLKSHIEGVYESSMNMIFSGASEAHLIADEIGELDWLLVYIETNQDNLSYCWDQCHPKTCPSCSTDLGRTTACARAATDK